MLLEEEQNKAEEIENENEETEEQMIDVTSLGSFFDQQRNNYFEFKRVLWLVGQISWEMAIALIQRLAFYNAQYEENHEINDPITLYISSPGGECDAGFAIIDSINELKKKGIIVNTICCGACSSMASVILASGSKGYRYAFPSSRIMIHQAGIELVGGRLKDIQIITKELSVWTDIMYKILKAQTGKTIDELKTMTSFDNYMSAAEAKKLGIVDHVKTKMA